MNNGGREFELRHWRSRTMSITIPPTPASPHRLLTPSPSLNGDLPSSSSYTSLRDIIGLADPSAAADGAVGSPSPGGEVRIRNRLLNKAACAYLQPTPSYTERGRRRRRGFSLRRALSSCFGFVGTFLRRVQIGKRT
ncbi:uncharacterized protein M6B38_276085 [Iris pallida]|uniref:Uncharacterized protein n=1 Tax=Iris pallida TaxID=29817 RepID=A0AAX6EJ94_IRIPA|nr:uncharacterized protein M6B38_186920 [Iris pallida]KAJ6847665.1 uncharacterized protein M6B38_276085 [Iris pallida]